ncbi:MAG: hypothetical protein RIB46_09720 [Pseudomonadales bacterium]
MVSTTRCIRAFIVPALLTLATIPGQLSAQEALGEPPAPLTSAPQAPAEIGTAYDIGPEPALRFTLDRAMYALGWTDHVPSASGMAGGDEKMLVLFFTIENVGTEAVRFRHNTLEFHAIDEQGLVHERNAALPVRAARLTTAADPATRSADDTLLRPAEPLRLYTAVLVPKRLRIPRLVVGTRRAGNNELAYALDGRIEPLPSAYHDGHPEIVREEVEAGPQQFLAAPSFDIQVDGIETTTDQARVGRRPGSEQAWALVRMTVRNRTDGPQNLSAGSFRETRLIDSAGELHAPQLVLHETRPERARPRIEAGATGSFLVAFPLPEGASPRALRLEVSGAGGKRSHRYRVPFGGGPRLSAELGAPVAPGVLYMGRYALMAEAPVREAPISIVPEAPPADPAPSDDAAPPAGGGADAGPGATAMPNIRRATIAIESVTASSPTEPSGDEPYLALWTFSGTLSQDGWPYLVVLESRQVPLGPNDFLTEGRTAYTPTGAPYRNYFPVQFENIPPYGFYLMAAAVMEADGNSYGQRRAFGEQLARAFSSHLRDAFDAAHPVDITDTSAAAQQTYLNRLVPVLRGLAQIDGRRLAEVTLGSGIGDDDDYLGMLVLGGVNLPALSNQQLQRFEIEPAGRHTRDLVFNYGITAGAWYRFNLLHDQSF